MPLLGTPGNLFKITKTGSSGPDEAAIVLCKHSGIWAPVCYRRIAVPAPPIDQLLDPGGPELCSIFTAGNDLLSIPKVDALSRVSFRPLSSLQDSGSRHHMLRKGLVIRHPRSRTLFFIWMTFFVEVFEENRRVRGRRNDG